MTDSNRRYDGLPVAELTLSNGALVRYRARRFLPRGGSLPVLAKVSITEGDRLDLISARAYGTAEALWRICDANDAMNPDELTAADRAGSVLIVPLPR